MSADLTQFNHNPHNGLYYDGNGRVICEDCGQPIPKYRYAPNGFVSPESDKTTVTEIGGREVPKVLEKAVCVPCYLKAFSRVYPNSDIPRLSTEVVENTTTVSIDESSLL